MRNSLILYARLEGVESALNILTKGLSQAVGKLKDFSFGARYDEAFMRDF